MAMTNSVTLVGHLGSDPEIRYTQSAQPVANFRMATNEHWLSDGKKQQHTEWHRIVVWGKQAESCAEYLSKGSQVMLNGRLRTRRWTDRDGNVRFTTEIVATQVQFLQRPKSQRVEEDQQDVVSPKDLQEEQTVLDEDVPF